MRSPAAYLKHTLLCRFRLPPELWLLLPFVAVFVVGTLVGLPVNRPDSSGLQFAEHHYFRPLLFALGAQGLVLLFRRRIGTHAFDVALIPSLAVLVLTATWLHFNFKAWMPLVHHRLFDEQLSITDAVLGPIVPTCIVLHRTLSSVVGSTIGYDIDRLYHDGFVAMFFASFTIHAVLDTPLTLRRLVVASSLVLLIGGIFYWLMPAKGPFVFRISDNFLARASQARMSQLFDQLVATGRIPPGYFVAAPAAMPSLHTAHAWLFTWYAARYHRWLFWMYLPLFCFILVEAVAASWHYVLDLPAGALLAVGCIWLSRRLVVENQSPRTVAARGTELGPDPG